MALDFFRVSMQKIEGRETLQPLKLEDCKGIYRCISLLGGKNWRLYGIKMAFRI